MRLSLLDARLARPLMLCEQAETQCQTCRKPCPSCLLALSTPQPGGIILGKRWRKRVLVAPAASAKSAKTLPATSDAFGTVFPGRVKEIRPGCRYWGRIRRMVIPALGSSLELPPLPPAPWNQKRMPKATKGRRACLLALLAPPAHPRCMQGQRGGMGLRRA